MLTTTPQDRLDLIKGIYDDAADNEPSDLAKAQTAALVAGIQANVANARFAYYSAEAAALSNTSAVTEVAYQAAVDAQKSVTDARTKAASIVDLIGSLQNATDKANALVKIAQSV